MFLVIRSTTAKGRVRTGCQLAITQGFALLLLIGAEAQPIRRHGPNPDERYDGVTNWLFHR
ncbi:hypothetical protein CFII68_13796 [Pseudomonas sp. CFII68]|nr:hypothetical protein CFII68_13796 [Pseudomonas sp. CFII68]